MTVPEFPTQDPASRELEKRIRALADSLSEDARYTLYALFSEAKESFEQTEFSVEDEHVVAHQRGAALCFPRPVPLVILSHIVFGYVNWLRAKYALSGFVEVEAGDIVVDCGAYVGGFAISASQIASQVHAFEPNLMNFKSLSKNLQGRQGAFPCQRGLYSKTEKGMLNISASSVEHSLLAPDDGTVISVDEIALVRLDDYMKELALPRIDFLKIEAEGVEPEVFEGLGSILPAKVAIDVSPERNGQSPAAEFKLKFDELGYEYRQRGKVLFARKK